MLIHYIEYTDMGELFQQTGKFCYWNCRNQELSIISIVGMSITCVLLSFIIYLYVKSRAVLKEEGVAKFYFFLLLWGIFFLGKDLFCVLGYFFHFKDSNTQQIDKTVAFFSCWFLILDILPGYILQTLLLEIPYHMINQVMSLIILKGYSLSKKEKRWQKLFSSYRILRLVFLLPLVFIALDSFSDKIQQKYSFEFSQIALICLDCIICLIILNYSVRYILNRCSLLQLSSQDKKNLKLQSIFIIFSTGIRLLVDFSFYFVTAIVTKNVSQNCIDNLDPKKSIVPILDTITMHFLPIIAIIYMYLPTQPDSQRKITIDVS